MKGLRDCFSKSHAKKMRAGNTSLETMLRKHNLNMSIYIYIRQNRTIKFVISFFECRQMDFQSFSGII